MKPIRHFPRKAKPSFHEGLGPVRLLSWIIFGAQFVAMSTWSTLLYERFCGTMDESSFFQAFFLIDHGHLDPFSTALGIPFIQDHGAILLWLLAPLELIGPPGLLVLLAQDAAIALAGLIAFRWICNVLKNSSPGFLKSWQIQSVAVLGLVLLAANPFTYTAISFDVHQEPFALPLIIAAAFDFSARRFRRAWIWVVSALLLGDVSASWIIGLAISAWFAGLCDSSDRRTLWKQSALLATAGVAWVGGLTAFGLEKNSSAFYEYLAVAPGAKVPAEIGHFQLLKAIVSHPRRILTTLFSHLHDMIANLAPTGVFGIFTPWTLGVPLIILVENGLTQGNLFSAPSFQSLPVYYFGAVGLIVLLTATFLRWPSRPIFVAVLALFVTNAVLWGAVFIPHLKETWLTVSSSQSSLLSRVESDIPASSEVVVSQGVSGRFANRQYIYMAAEDVRIPVHGKHIWFVLAPSAGIEFSEIGQSNIASQLADSMHATRILTTDGIYVFRWTRPTDVKAVEFRSQSSIDAWTAQGTNGLGVFNGTPTEWFVAPRGNLGFIVSGDYWNKLPGHYVASVKLCNSVPVSMVVFNATSGQILSYQVLAPSHAIHTVSLSVTLRGLASRIGAFGGHGIISINSVSPPQGNEMEVLVSNSKKGEIHVYEISLKRTSSTVR